MLYLTHLVACSWFRLGLLEYERGIGGWLINNGFLDADIVTKYINSYYFAILMMTPIVGNIIPITNLEKLLGIFIAICATVLFAFCLNSISIMLREMNSSK